MARCREAKKTLSHILTLSVFFTQMQLNVPPYGTDKSSYISGHQLLSVIHVLHGGDALRAEVEVIWVGGHQQHVWNKELTGRVTVLP